MGRTQRHRKKNRENKLNNLNSFDISELFKYICSFGWKNEKQLAIRNFVSSGRGLMTKLGVEVNDLMVEIPFASMISLWTLETDSEFKEILQKSNILNNNNIQYQSLLSLYLIFKISDKKSLLQFYFNSLPSQFSTPYFCNKQELSLLPNNILKAVVEQNNIIRDQFDIFHKNLIEFSEVFKMCLEKFKWAYFIVNSRCVFVDPNIFKKIIEFPQVSKCLKDEPRFALAPFLDLLNHSDIVTNKVEISEYSAVENIKYKIFSNEKFNKYQQCFISYGQLTNFKLLIDYGFFIPNNKHDFFSFNLEDIEDLVKQEKKLKTRIFHKNKFKFIRDHNLDNLMLIDLNDGPSHNMNIVLYLIFKEESHYPNILSQIAFGDYICENDIKCELKLLIELKIQEYEKYVVGLKNIEVLTISGQVCLDYINYYIEYLKKYLEK